MHSDAPKHPLIRPTERGLFCETGGFYIDPWRPVDRALITHGHSDHARSGMGRYLTSAAGVPIVRERVGHDAPIEGIPFGERRKIGEVHVSFHPAGHLLGSAQIRVEHRGEVWVVTGDYKTDPDISCEAFEPVSCDTLITESTFGLPVYRWPEPEKVFRQIHQWWRDNQEEGRTSILFAYALGKAQRVLCGLDPSIGPIGIHGAVARLNPHYREAGIPLPETIHANAETRSILRGRGLIVAPGSAQNTPWIRRFAPYSLSFASGWMAVRGSRRRRALDRGFVLSDHVDWPGLLQTIEASGASRIGVTHGYAAPLIRWLREERGLAAYEIPTRYAGESEEENPEEKPKEEES
ncbi:ligase-associated DNA damage response exonuclease [Puniceicoccus vermicola]|uniref:Ligase-associated DNA damage response exonuclease n=1 Tax=Puniceicoccus vermicola TaxID=388746 RepID=A0A7X1AYZ3_9BACT|nr:ligase-associated DNA damage response exonuclease [Puniceicoccus vermicola]